MSARPPEDSQEHDLSNLDYALRPQYQPGRKADYVRRSGVEGGGDTGGVYILKDRWLARRASRRRGAGTMSRRRKMGLLPTRSIRRSSSCCRSERTTSEHFSGRDCLAASSHGCSSPGFPPGRVRGREPGRSDRIWLIGIEGKPRPISPEGAPYAPSSRPPDGRYVMALGDRRPPDALPVDGGEPRPIPGPPWRTSGPSGRPTAGGLRLPCAGPGREGDGRRRGDGSDEALEGDRTARSVGRARGRPRVPDARRARLRFTVSCASFLRFSRSRG